VKSRSTNSQTIIRVTPIRAGTSSSVVTALVVAGAVVVARGHIHRFVHVYDVVGALIVAFVGIRALTRVIRWRSHSIVVAPRHLEISRGLVRRHVQHVSLDHVISIHTDRSIRSRVARRGEVLLETTDGTISLGRLRQPRALVRVIELQRERLGRRPLDSGVLDDSTDIRSFLHAPHHFDVDPFAE
jgi:membrane protein YdbS with pleckstrin-like domain